MSVRDLDPHSPSDVVAATSGEHRQHRKGNAQRYAAVVAALIDVRPDEATARFDAELAKAVAEHRIDDETARALRWWQRASVRAAETYATTIVPRVLAIRDEAEAHAIAEADEAAASWSTATTAKTASFDKPPREAIADGTVATDRDVEPPVAEVAAVHLVGAAKAASPEPEPCPVAANRSHTTEETRRAVRAAFALVASDAESASSKPDLAATVVTMVPSEGKDARRNAHPATSA